MTKTMASNDDPTTFTDEELDDLLGIRRKGAPGSRPDWTGSDFYPRMSNLSAAFLYGDVMVRAEAPTPAEYVTVPIRRTQTGLQVAVAEWNILWESAQFRRRFFDEAKLPRALAEVAGLGDNNVVFVPRTPSRYFEYSPLYHLLPRSTVEHHNLPLLRTGIWPHISDVDRVTDALPENFATRLAEAWASHVWRHLMPGSRASGFTSNDPIRLLAQNLDFWLPAASEVMHDILSTFPVVGEPTDPQPVPLQDGSTLEGAVLAPTRVGSDLWVGEADAAEVTEWIVDQADAGGRLRGILDAVRSNRVEDDFSERWTFAREDFERKLYRKRAKVKVTFVELTDTIPVQGPESEVIGETVTSDFLALLNQRDREVVVLLNSGHTNLTEVGGILGYSNHSAVSKRLARIRRLAEQYFDGI